MPPPYRPFGYGQGPRGVMPDTPLSDKNQRAIYRKRVHQLRKMQNAAVNLMVALYMRSDATTQTADWGTMVNQNQLTLVTLFADAWARSIMLKSTAVNDPSYLGTGCEYVSAVENLTTEWEGKSKVHADDFVRLSRAAAVSIGRPVPVSSAGDRLGFQTPAEPGYPDLRCVLQIAVGEDAYEYVEVTVGARAAEFADARDRWSITTTAGAGQTILLDRLRNPLDNNPKAKDVWSKGTSIGSLQELDAGAKRRTLLNLQGMSPIPELRARRLLRNRIHVRVLGSGSGSANHIGEVAEDLRSEAPKNGEAGVNTLEYAIAVLLHGGVRRRAKKSKKAQDGNDDDDDDDNDDDGDGGGATGWTYTACRPNDKSEHYARVLLALASALPPSDAAPSGMPPILYALNTLLTGTGGSAVATTGPPPPSASTRRSNRPPPPSASAGPSNQSRTTTPAAAKQKKKKKKTAQPTAEAAGPSILGMIARATGFSGSLLDLFSDSSPEAEAGLDIDSNDDDDDDDDTNTRKRPAPGDPRIDRWMSIVRTSQDGNFPGWASDNELARLFAGAMAERYEDRHIDAFAWYWHDATDAALRYMKENGMRGFADFEKAMWMSEDAPMWYALGSMRPEAADMYVSFPLAQRIIGNDDSLQSIVAAIPGRVNVGATVPMKTMLRNIATNDAADVFQELSVLARARWLAAVWMRMTNPGQLQRATELMKSMARVCKESPNSAQATEFTRVFDGTGIPVLYPFFNLQDQLVPFVKDRVKRRPAGPRAEVKPVPPPPVDLPDNGGEWEGNDGDSLQSAHEGLPGFTWPTDIHTPLPGVKPEPPRVPYDGRVIDLVDDDSEDGDGDELV